MRAKEGNIVELFVLITEGPEVANVFSSSAENHLSRKTPGADTGFFNNGWKVKVETYFKGTLCF